MVIDVMRTSASRPELLIKSTLSMRENIKFSGELRYLLHEDVLNQSASKELLAWADKDGQFNKIMVDNPPIGQGLSLNKLFEDTNSEFIINWEDDFNAVRPVDLDLCVKILMENPDVNQIAFNKRSTMSEVSGWKKKEVIRSGQKLMTSPHWRLTPAIWRRSFIKRFWLKNNGSAFNWLLADRIKKMVHSGWTSPNCEWIEKHVGTYYLGGDGELAFVEHTGGGKSVRCKDYRWKNL